MIVTINAALSGIASSGRIFSANIECQSLLSRLPHEGIRATTGRGVPI